MSVGTRVKIWAFPCVALLAVIMDQVSKLAIRMSMTQGQSIPEEGFFRITYCANAGGVFGLEAPQAFLITLSVIVIALIIFVYYRYPMTRKAIMKMSLGLMLGGAIGNLIDRLIIGEFGEVVDFIDVGAWPVFNLADTAIVIGTLLIVFYLIFIDRKERCGLSEHE